jgi:hypothetical protein
MRRAFRGQGLRGTRRFGTRYVAQRIETVHVSRQRRFSRCSSIVRGADPISPAITMLCVARHYAARLRCQAKSNCTRGAPRPAHLPHLHTSVFAATGRFAPVPGTPAILRCQSRSLRSQFTHSRRMAAGHPRHFYAPPSLTAFATPAPPPIGGPIAVATVAFSVLSPERLARHRDECDRFVCAGSRHPADCATGKQIYPVVRQQPRGAEDGIILPRVLGAGISLWVVFAVFGGWGGFGDWNYCGFSVG